MTAEAEQFAAVMVLNGVEELIESLRRLGISSRAALAALDNRLCGGRETVCMHMHYSQHEPEYETEITRCCTVEREKKSCSKLAKEN